MVRVPSLGPEVSQRGVRSQADGPGAAHPGTLSPPTAVLHLLGAHPSPQPSPTSKLTPQAASIFTFPTDVWAVSSSSLPARPTPALGDSEQLTGLRLFRNPTEAGNQHQKRIPS